MRTPEEMFALFKRIARSDERVRAMTLEGSRANPGIAPDVWQDYDLTFLVKDVGEFTRSDEWLTGFGELLLLQKPEAMALFEPGIPEGWFSYLMLFTDGVKIDLTLVPAADTARYFRQDPLIRVLLDKDGLCQGLSEPSDRPFWVQKPDAAFVRDCTNEFCMSSTYLARGILRKEWLSACWMMEQVTRVELLRMLGYLAGARQGFPLNTGKHDKWLPRYLSEAERALLAETYRLGDIGQARRALVAAMDLFEAALKEVCAALGYDCPSDLEKTRGYIRLLQGLR